MVSSSCWGTTSGLPGSSKGRDGPERAKDFNQSAYPGTENGANPLEWRRDINKVPVARDMTKERIEMFKMHVWISLALGGKLLGRGRDVFPRKAKR